LRARLAADLAERGSAALHAELARQDPAAAARIHPHDAQRIQRALEVCLLSGRPLTELCRVARDEFMPPRSINLIIAPAVRALLHQRIAARFQAMLEQGFIAEVERLRARGDLHPDTPAMRAVGYRQVWDYLDGMGDHALLVERGTAATRQLAKRQLTWLRAETDATWLDSDASNLLDAALERLRAAGFFQNMPGRLC
jgi:tRNA dimethylallyltransferase